MILVVGATGMVGSEVCERLVTQGKKVGALVRPSADAAKVKRLEVLGVELLQGDLREPATLEAACRHSEVVISTASAVPFTYEAGVNDIQTTDLNGMRSLLAAARSARVKRFVYMSFSANINIAFPLQKAKRIVEHELKQSGLAYTILRPSYFMEAWLAPVMGFDPANAKATIYGIGGKPVSYVSYHDVAAFLVRSLEAPAAKNATLELGGPQAISQLGVVDIFERTAHCRFDVRFVPEPILEQRQQAAAADPLQQSATGLMRCLAHGDAIDMHKLRKVFPLHLTSVKDYATSCMAAA
jgi:uncharacterized protein YbjT (DUF2867 family)